VSLAREATDTDARFPQEGSRLAEAWSRSHAVARWSASRRDGIAAGVVAEREVAAMVASDSAISVERPLMAPTPDLPQMWPVTHNRHSTLLQCD